MTSPLEPSPSGDAAAVLAVQVAALRGQVRLIFARLDMAGITRDLNLADQFAELARAVTQALDSPPRGPLPLTGSASTPPATPAGSRNSGSGPTPSCAANTAATSCAAAGPPPARHLGTVHPGRRMAPHLQRQPARPGPGTGFHDRWLPGTMRRIGDITRRCNPECARRPAPKAAHGLTPFAQQPPPAPERTRAMTTVKLTSAELRLLDIQKAPRHPLPRRHLCLAGSERRRDRRAGSSGGTRRPGSRGRAMRVARKPGRADRGAAHRGRRHSSRGHGGSGAGGGPDGSAGRTGCGRF